MYYAGIDYHKRYSVIRGVGCAPHTDSIPREGREMRKQRFAGSRCTVVALSRGRCAVHTLRDWQNLNVGIRNPKQARRTEIPMFKTALAQPGGFEFRAWDI